ncbi:4-amino-4-deoxy-L-arabinose transferase [Lishizhenia tianjinensis]|uniref:4-amino-4-deoxy-L-arabinose transferase n=1 Tax=Lishizhenia tianjinensis TaxID=477690 RepID=A0A1I6YZN7_9FLAO|nr:phospholipid carrier-dependent glycosyltransferase [Lishizhenia tianjinensis]SFT55872.1 4-amino-4-deoxy-L-arabinose transferase [Lishizhenia tianjinensis]
MSKKITEKKPSPITAILKKATLYLYLLVISVSYFSTYPETYDEKVFLGGDNAAYYLLGKAIADGEGYVNSHLLNSPAANHFPPGYSFVIGQVLKVTDGDIQTIKHLNGFFFLCVLLLIFFIARKLSKNDHLAFVTSMFLLFNMHYLMYSSIVMSEMIFAFFSLLTIFAFIQRREDIPFYKSPWFFVGIIAMIFAIYIRTQGVVFLGVWILWGIVRKNWLPMIVGVSIVVLALVPWQIRTSNLGGSGYQKQLKMVNPYNKSLGEVDFDGFLTRMGNNATRYLGKEIPNAITPRFYVNYKKDASGVVPGPTVGGYLLGSLYIVLLVFGAWRLKKWRWFMLFYLGGNLAVFLCWPDVWFGVRFMFPVIPLVTFLIFFGLFELVNIVLKMVSKNKRELAPALALLFLVFCTLHLKPYDQYKRKANSPYPLNWRNYMDLSKWAKEGIPEGSVVACRKPHLFAIESDKKVSSFRYTAELDTVLADLIDNGVTHVVVESIGFTATFKYLYPTVQKYRDKFRMIHRVDPEEILRQKNPAAFKGKNSTGAFIFEFNPNVGYFGEFDENNKRSGQGKFIRTDGTVFEGQWKDGTLHGQAAFVTPQGEKYEGNFDKGKRQGLFKYTDTTQAVYNMVFQQDTLISKTKI